MLYLHNISTCLFSENDKRVPFSFRLFIFRYYFSLFYVLPLAIYIRVFFNFSHIIQRALLHSKLSFKSVLIPSLFYLRCSGNSLSAFRSPSNWASLSSRSLIAFLRSLSKSSKGASLTNFLSASASLSCFSSSSIAAKLILRKKSLILKLV